MAVKGIPLWQQKAAEARAHRDASLAKVEPPLKGVPAVEQLPKNSLELVPHVLTPREIEITESYTVTELLQVLRERKISVEEVTRAFLRRAALAQATTNCVTELLWDQAIARAKHLDSLPSPQGALFGLPISTKEHLGMIGENVTSNASFAAWVGKPHGSNLLFDSLWAEGCVFFARTTQPQAIMHLETESNVYGRTVHPFNRELTPGGSSGGESALLGMRGSLLGIGGDIGGSIRLPASNTGIYGFKPSTKRISTSGLRAAYLGRDTIAGCPGPMTWNLLDYPGAVFPVTKVDPAVDVKDEGYPPKNDMDRFVWEMYDGEKMKGSPVNLQVVGRRQEEEKVLAALEEIERAMGRK
ncbi:general amidase [Fusarium fujikuroi]|nr:general amidase [Fusarium fujikuroi]